MDPYQSCPCGSGKNFKWCCQPYYHLVEKALSFQERKQYDSAIQTVQQLVQKHPGSASALGYQAQILMMNGRLQEADEQLEKAFAIEPNFPFGHWLRAAIRSQEGEDLGALMEYRKAEELYDPRAHDVLSEVYASIFELEMKFHRPIAARAALERAIRHQPANQPLRDALTKAFGPTSGLPETARKDWKFRPAAPARAAAWKAALPADADVRLCHARQAFEKLTEADEKDAAAFFNLGLILAWLGDNAEALDPLQQAIDLEEDDALNEECGVLIEILRCGAGMDHFADHLQHQKTYTIEQFDPVAEMVQHWGTSGRLVGAEQNREEARFSALVLEDVPRFGESIGPVHAPLDAYLLIFRNFLRIWHPDENRVERVAAELNARAGSAIVERQTGTAPITFTDLMQPVLMFPMGESNVEQDYQKICSRAQEYFEETWLSKPLKALSGVTPVDAASHSGIRKRLRGVIRFLEECFNIMPVYRNQDGTAAPPVYDFNRLRHKLGLGGAAPAPTAGEIDFDRLSTAELAALDPDNLKDVELDTAFRASLKLDASELAANFARKLSQRPANPDLPDRFACYSYLINAEATEGKIDAALALLDSAAQADAAMNQSLRQNDWSLRRGQLLARKGSIDEAYAVFKSLLERNPDELKYYGPAVETLLSHRKGAWASELAERGLTRSRALGNRDSERYLLELAAAASRLG